MMATAGYRLSFACATSLLVYLVCRGEPAPSLSFSSSLLPTNSSRPASSTDPNICIVIRTYWADGKTGNGNLYSMLKSFQQQSYERWQAVLLVMDDKLFRDLRPTIYDMKDDRIWAFAEHVGPNFKPKEGKGWKPFYHAKLYNLTDEAIRACPRTTEWVLVTNGDNQYSTELFEQIVSVGGDVDVISMDYYSRYQRPTGPPCERFQAAAGLPSCKVNRHRFCHTDLGANVLRWPRLIREDRRFGTLRQDPSGQFFAHDGVLMDRLSRAGWSIQRLPKCLFDHSPSPQRCQREGGVWDDSGPAKPDSMGGKCLSPEEAKRLLHESAGVLEVIDVALSHDGLLPSFPAAPGADAAAGGKLQCIRKKGNAAWQQEALNFFGPKCADDVDLGGTPRTRLIRSVVTGGFVVVPLPRRKGSYTPKFRQLMPVAMPAPAAERPDRSEL